MESTERSWVSERRRSILQLLGVATGGGFLAKATGTLQAESSFVLVQDGECVPLEPLSGSERVEELYGYQLPAGEYGGDNGARDDGGPYFGSTGTTSLQQDDASLLFLYDGPEGLSLVVVHDSGGESPNGGGAATFTVSGLPADGLWVVKDDLYLDPETGEPAATNYDRWAVDGSPHRIDWTWGNNTDGGAFRGLGSDVEVTIDPAFNQAADLYGQYYEGQVTEWQALSGSLSNPDRHPLDMSKPVTIASGSCGGSTPTATPTPTPTAAPDDTAETSGDGVDGEQDTETETEPDTETESETETEPDTETESETETEPDSDTDRQQTKHERKQRKHERKQRKHQRKEERKQRKQERKQRKHERKQRKHQRKEGEEDEDDEEEEGESGRRGGGPEEEEGGRGGGGGGR